LVPGLSVVFRCTTDPPGRHFCATTPFYLSQVVALWTGDQRRAFHTRKAAYDRTGVTIRWDVEIDKPLKIGYPRGAFIDLKELLMTVIIQLHEGVAINKFALDKKLIRIGRDPECEIFIDDKVVSMEHAVIETVDVPENKGQKEFYIKDLGSTNCTFVNDKQITRQKLNHDDLIRVGWTSLRFVKEIDRKTEKTLRIHKSWIPGVYYTKE
jgi:hypothetical protein